MGDVVKLPTAGERWLIRDFLLQFGIDPTPSNYATDETDKLFQKIVNCVAAGWDVSSSNPDIPPGLAQECANNINQTLRVAYLRQFIDLWVECAKRDREIAELKARIAKLEAGR